MLIQKHIDNKNIQIEFSDNTTFYLLDLEFVYFSFNIIVNILL